MKIFSKTEVDYSPRRSIITIEIMETKCQLFYYSVNRIAFLYMAKIAVPCYNFTNVVECVFFSP